VQWGRRHWMRNELSLRLKWLNRPVNALASF